MMRGGEVETVAVIESLPKGQPYLLVLPGSHTKFVSVDRDEKDHWLPHNDHGRLLSVITNDTLIADAVGHSFASEETYAKRMFSQDTGLPGDGNRPRMFLCKDLKYLPWSRIRRRSQAMFSALSYRNDMEAVKNSSVKMRC